jgi:hypothetical protein
MACPPLENLLDLIRGAIDKETEAVVRAHMSSGCKTCAENHRWLTALLATTAEDDSFDFSEETIRWSVAQFKAASASQPSKMQILARLIFDNLLPARAVEVRSMAAPAVSRQMLYQAGPYDVDLRLEQSEETNAILVLGQIVSRTAKPGGLAGLSVEMTRHDAGGEQEDAKRVETDSRGMFRLRDVTPGEYDIVIHAPEGELSINAITCRPQ